MGGILETYEQIEGIVISVHAYFRVRREDGSEVILDVSSPIADEYYGVRIRASAVVDPYDIWGDFIVESLHDLSIVEEQQGQ